VLEPPSQVAVASEKQDGATARKDTGRFKHRPYAGDEHQENQNGRYDTGSNQITASQYPYAGAGACDY
jgi:hypothetical protein